MEAVHFEFATRDEDIDYYEEKIQDANEVWNIVFNNIYEEKCCPSDYVIVGYNYEYIPVVAAIYEILKINNKFECFISSVAASPKNIGNGTKLMEALIKNINEYNIDYIYLNISKNKNKNKLIKFYNKFGFNKYSTYGNDYNGVEEIQRCLYLK